MKRIRVLLVDDHQIMREGLIALLHKAEDIEVIAEAADGNQALDKALELDVDVVVMDLTLPGLSGIEATRKILEAAPAKQILALSMIDERSCVVESLKAGAKGYLVKSCAARELIEAIRTLAAGESYLCSKVTNLVIQDFTRDGSQKHTAATPPLTKREREILSLIASGRSTKEIAFSLAVSIKTIDVHRSRIMKKLNLYSIAELTKYALREGLATLE